MHVGVIDFTDLREPGIYRGIIGLLAGGTARADTPFLRMPSSRGGGS